MEGCDVRSRQHLVLRVIVYSLPWFTPHETAMVESAISRPEERSFLLKAYVGLRTHGFSSLEYTDKNNFAILRWVMKRGIDLRNFQLTVRHNCCSAVYITDRDKVLGELINMEEYGIATYYAQRNDVLDIMHSIYYEEAKTRIHMSTLCLAIYRGSCCQEITEILLKKGADPNVTVEYGWTPLYLASIHAHDHTIVRALLAAGASVQTSNCIEETPLHIACHHGHLDAVVSFIEAGADVTKGDRNGETPLYRAAFHSGQEEVVRILLACEGVDANIRTSKGETPLSVAAYKNFIPAVALLLAAGADVNTADKNGRTPLYRAAYNGASSAVTALLEAGADVTLTTDNNWSPLHIASYKGHTAIVTALLAAGANSCIDQLDRAGGRTPLMMAGSEGHSDIVAALLAAGADVTLATKTAAWTAPCSQPLTMAS